MAWNNEPVSLEYDDDDILDRMMPDMPEPPAYPPNLCFSVNEDELEQAAGAPGSVGDCMDFAAMAEVTSVHVEAERGRRVELRITEFAGDDGKFFDLKTPGYICFCDYELDKLGLDCDCEVGDMIHLIGEVCLKAVHRHEFGSNAELQIQRLTFEDESSESRDEE